MLIVDVETSGVDPDTCGILSIGAVDFSHPACQFYGECQIRKGAVVTDQALRINGFTRESIHDANKPIEQHLLRQFMTFILPLYDRTLAAHNVTFDRDFLNHAFRIHHMHAFVWKRTVDAHTLCFAHQLKQGMQPPLQESQSALSLNHVLVYVGLPEEPYPHHALTGAKLVAESLHRLIYGTPLFEEYQKHQIPDYLKQ